MRTSPFSRTAPRSWLTLLALAAVLWVPMAGVSAAEKENDTTFSAAELRELSASFVLVKFHFQRSEEEVGDEFSYMMEGSSKAMKYDEYLGAKAPMKVLGVVVKPDAVLIMDTIIDDEYLKRIEVDDLQGGSSPARRAAILTETPGMLLKIERPERLKSRVAKFAELPEKLTADAKLFEIVMLEQGAGFAATAGPLRQGVWRDDAGTATEESLLSAAFNPASERGGQFDYMSGYRNFGQIGKRPTLILNAEKRPVGVGLVRRLPAAPNVAPRWRGGDILADKSIAWADFDARKQELKQRLSGAIYEIKITFRQKAEGPSSMFDRGFYMGRSPGDDGAPRELYYHGLATAPRTLFVPRRIQRAHAKVIERITVQAGGKTLSGKLQGAYKDIAGFLVRLDADLPAAPQPLFSPEPLKQYEPLVSILPLRKFGGMRLELNYSRPASRIRGYKDLLEHLLLGDNQVGVFCADQQGRIKAVVVEQRIEDEEKQQFRDGGGYGGYYSEFRRVYTADELQPLLAGGPGLFDPNIVAMSEKEEKTKLWLGVEFDGINHELAKALGIEKQTKDGGIGLILSLVYPGSPAAALGLEVGDILLKIKEAGDEEPIDLTGEESYDYNMGGDDFDIPDELGGAGMRMQASALWKPRQNMFTMLLDAIGEGKTVELTYLKAQEIVTKTFKTVKAPQDFDSAEKFKDEKVGLTVKELTYEVRNALKLDAGAKAVIVAKVEPGRPAAVARISPLELIVKIGDQEVPNVEVFKKIIADAKQKAEAEGRVTLRITLRRLDKTRLADLTLEK